MKFELTSEQELIQKTAREFAANEIAPHSAQWDREATFPADVVKKLAELGFLGMNVPEALGGAGLDTLSYILAVEEISRGDASVGVIMSVNNSLFGHALRKFGTAAQKEKYLAAVAGGGDRQRLHERIRQHSQQAAAVIKLQGGENDAVGANDELHIGAGRVLGQQRP